MMNLTKFKLQMVGEGHIERFISENRVCFIEPKIDGVRIALQKVGNNIKLFGRTGKDVTSKYASIIPDLLKEITAEKVTLDGELAVVKGKEITSSNYAIRRTLTEGERYMYFPFDILELNEELLTDLSLLSRKQSMQLLLEPKKVITEIPYTPVDNMEDVNNIIKKVIERRMEGIVIKSIGAYSPGTRYNWIKLKPIRTIDMDVIDKKPKKDCSGWIYTLTNKTTDANIACSMDISIGDVVEVKFEKRFERRLRFPQIIRIRNDLKPFDEQIT